ncbi:MAG: hypothetical protein ACXVCN_18780 [Bdellovibrio sp.]
MKKQTLKDSIPIANFLSKWPIAGTQALFVISLAIFVWSLWHRTYHIDDVWLAEFSYWLDRVGYVKSEAIRGFLNSEIRHYVYHKIFAIEGAWIIHFFGLQPYALKSLSLIYTALSLPLLAVIYKKYSSNGKYLFLLFAIFLSFYHTVNLGFTFRPELNLVFLFLLSFIFFDKYLDSSRRIFMVIAALIGGLAIATHLNGTILVGASVLFLWLQRRWLAGFFYGVIASWGLFFYFFYDVRSLAELHQSVLQLTNHRDVTSGKYGLELFIRLIEEQGRYLHSPPEIIYTLMLVLLLASTRKYLAEQQKRVLFFAGLLFLFTAEVTHGINTNYLMCSFPFFILLSVLAFEKLLAEGRKKIAWTAVLIFFIGSWAFNISQFKRRELMAPEYAKVAEFIPKEVQVLAPEFLMFQGLGKFHIQTYSTYIDKVAEGKINKTPEQLFAEALKFDIEFVVLDKYNMDFFNVKASSYGPYSLSPTQPSQEFVIFTRNH